MMITQEHLQHLKKQISVKIMDTHQSDCFWLISNDGKKLTVKYGNRRRMKVGLIKYVGIDALLQDSATLSVILDKCRENAHKSILEGC